MAESTVGKNNNNNYNKTYAYSQIILSGNTDMLIFIENKNILTDS